MTASISISIPGITPLELSKSYHGHWANRRRAWGQALRTAEILWNVAEAVGDNGAVYQGPKGLLFPWKRVVLGYKSYWCGGKSLDRDNLIARCSAYLDAAVRADIILDDGPDFVLRHDTTYERVKHRSEAKTTITIREVAP